MLRKFAKPDIPAIEPGVRRPKLFITNTILRPVNLLYKKTNVLALAAGAC
jgi:hypothetical protein